MHIELSVRDGVPIYRQVINQIRYLIAAGQLAVGDELPPIRTLAEQLSITPNTVVKAYDALEAEGLVVKRQGAGTYVAELASPLKKSEQRRLLTERADALLAEAKQLNFSYQELLELLCKRQALLDKSWSKEQSHG
ncbi:MAG: GntR family transcriptional regulator [Aureliella sp.]